MIPYPQSFFDPDPDAARVQCRECGRWFSATGGDVEETEEVPCPGWNTILMQGICLNCKESA